jgi:hypothetical protein
MFKKRNSETPNSTPPDGLSPEEAAEWWRNTLAFEGKSMSTIETRWQNYQRKCPKCGSINDCTSSSVCNKCHFSLENAKKVPARVDQRFNPDLYGGYEHSAQYHITPDDPE